MNAASCKKSDLMVKMYCKNVYVTAVYAIWSLNHKPLLIIRHRLIVYVSNSNLDNKNVTKLGDEICITHDLIIIQ